MCRADQNRYVPDRSVDVPRIALGPANRLRQWWNLLIPSVALQLSSAAGHVARRPLCPVGHRSNVSAEMGSAPHRREDQVLPYSQQGLRMALENLPRSELPPPRPF